MEIKIIMTKDGSHSISIPEMNVTYHSIHGAIQESKHVFIEAGLNASGRFHRPDALNILEVGFGTGLNALLTLIEAINDKFPIRYSALEPYPLKEQEYNSLNYCEVLNTPSLQSLFKQLHIGDWEKEIKVNPYFTLLKSNQSLLNFTTNKRYDLVYFDAFAPAAQPELWTTEVFEKLYAMMSANGILVTYCSKGDVRRAMLSAGFSVEKIPGPVGKREMIRCRTTI
jgi:tRNA U34 5-methylaminomethyl-2-thiouridine-forming methyltransferase MnmC